MNDPITGEPKRPTLLTVLCILSFIGIGFMVLGGAIGYVGMKMFASGALQEAVEQRGDSSASAQMEDMQAQLDEAGMTADQAATQMLIVIVCALVSLVGMIMMWKLRKPGFYIFTACVVAVIAAPLLMGGKLAASGLVLPVVLVAFVGLFYTQVKHMS